MDRRSIGTKERGRCEEVAIIERWLLVRKGSPVVCRIYQKQRR